MKGIVVDSSAVLAIAFEEPDADIFERALVQSNPIMSAATRVEVAHATMRRFGIAGIAAVERLLMIYRIAFVPLDEKQSALALEALLAYGKGRGQPPAALNMGDTFSYALAKTRNLPLLYKGDDFSRTDIRSALDVDTDGDGAE